MQAVIDEHIRSWEHRGTIRDIMLAQFREDWEHITEGRFELAMEEFLEHRRSLPRKTLQGESVKSFGEKVIANALFENSVEYKYERNFRWDGVNYRPDFTIQWGRGGIVIEYFGLSGDPDYDEMSNEKRRYWGQRDDWRLIEFTPNDLRVGIDAFVDGLLAQLRSVGIQTRPLAEEEIWERVRERAVDNFSKAMKTFITRCRKRNLDAERADCLGRELSSRMPVGGVVPARGRADLRGIPQATATTRNGGLRRPGLAGDRPASRGPDAVRNAPVDGSEVIPRGSDSS